MWKKVGWLGATAGVFLFGATAVICAGAAGFLGKVAVEWDDSDLFNRHRVTLLADFGFQDTAGQQWIARKGAVLDGASFPPLYEQMVGLPFVGEHRRAGILHDYFAQQLTHDWKKVRRMYFEALLAEGLSVAEAKTAYAVLYGVGLRWEVKGSSCYVNCHSAASSLAWKPDVTEAELEPVLELLGEGNPTLDEIDRAVDAAVPKPGPHLFSQLRPEENGALQPEAREGNPAPAPEGESEGERDDDAKAREGGAAPADEKMLQDEEASDGGTAEQDAEASSADTIDTPAVTPAGTGVSGQPAEAETE